MREPCQEPARPGFTLWIRTRRVLKPSALKALQSRLEQFLDERDIRCSGGPLELRLWADDRALTGQDQLELLDWLMEVPGLDSVAFSPLNQLYDEPPPGDRSFVFLDCSDAAVVALTRLHRVRRISPKTCLDLLDGFVRPALLH